MTVSLPPNARVAPAAERNKGPIAEVLERHLPERGLVLEIASGTGQHAAHFATTWPNLTWQPSDANDDALQSIAAWRQAVDATNLRAPLRLDVRDRAWPIEHADVVVSINMIHISPWDACLGLLHGAGRILEPGGLLFLYGPYKVDGEHTAPTNAQFDASLRARNPAWGIRDMGAVVAEAEQVGLLEREHVAMPANNFTIVLHRR